VKLPSPQRLGLPEKFVSWRFQQERAILALIDSETRYSGVNAPTGSGKTGIALGLAQLLPHDERVLILTSTKALQDQVVEDAYALGLRDIRGKANYRCVAASPGGALADLATTAADATSSFVSVEHGPCFTAGVECPLRASGCEWFDAIRSARDARIVSTNYAKWISTPNYEDEFGKFEWIVCDEAADAEQHLTDALHIDLRKHEVESVLRIGWPAGAATPGVGGTRIEDWREWARHHRARVDETVKTAEAAVKEAVSTGRGTRLIRELAGKLTVVRRLSTALAALRTLRGEWVLDDLRAYDRVIGAAFDPVWPAPYAASLLFRDIPHVVLMGATLVEKHLDILGVPKAERTFTTYPSTFPVARRPIVYVKLDPPLKMSWKAEQSESFRRRVAAVGDALMGARADRNSLTHAISYKRAQYLTQYAAHEHRERIITHSSDARLARTALKRFKSLKDDPPWHLVSPSMMTGIDLPGTEAEWCWIPKLPFEPDSVLMRARRAIDPRYPDFRVANTMMQAVGRGMRSPSDSFEVIITDSGFAWFPWKNRDLFASHFIDAIRSSSEWPRCPPKLKRS
jgi:Rad3-related DNA helicase